MVRSLDHGQAFILAKPAHGELQEGAHGDVIAVEDSDVFGVGVLERAIDIAGFGVGVIEPGKVSGPASAANS